MHTYSTLTLLKGEKNAAAHVDNYLALLCKCILTITTKYIARMTSLYTSRYSTNKNITGINIP